MKSFIESQFAYGLLVWMFHDINLKNKINKQHERTLRLLYMDDYSTFIELLTNYLYIIEIFNQWP